MRNSDIFGYTMLVLGLGIITGLLIAPRKGEETRKMLREHMEEYCGKAGEFITEKAAEIKKQAGKFKETLKDNLEGSE